MQRQPTPRQFDLFSSQPAARTPRWQTLPEGMRLRLTKLLVRLILEHVDGKPVTQREEANHDA
jgi:hypothetical protein